MLESACKCVSEASVSNPGLPVTRSVLRSEAFEICQPAAIFI